jgi:heme/copper-type cytochrome/quinol oxidase subunit 1
MEFAPDGDLSKVIKKWKLMKRPMPEDLIWRLCIQVTLPIIVLPGLFAASMLLLCPLMFFASFFYLEATRIDPRPV